MSDDARDDTDLDALDVVLLHAPTDDGEGAQVIRARGQTIEAGEVRPMREGRPLPPKSEVVKLTKRKESPLLYDVRVEHVVAPVGESPTQAAGPANEAVEARTGPPQVATRAYRESWERTFGPRRARSLN
jgi:hypothetical protein